MLRLYNTLTRQLEDFHPIDGNKVGMYTCGPTVYQYAHIGNLRSYIFADILRRTLKFNDYATKQVMNITDVGHLTSDADTGEDKLEKASREQSKSAWEIAEYYTSVFVKDLEKLNIALPDVFPKATAHIPEQIDLIKKLEKKGYTYLTPDGVYFDTSKFKNYGQMARLNLKGQKAGARVGEVAGKRSPYDFALWKLSPQGEKRQMEWESPWGVGFPGWHIECSAMATKYLGQPFDIHTGGIDHIPVHHTNEIAQSEAAYGKPLANYFLHNEFLVWGQEKLSKSLGNIVTLSHLEEQGYDPISFRYLMLTAHYRSKIKFSFEALRAAETAVTELRERVSSAPKGGQINHTFLSKFREKINNDLDTPGALAVMWGLLKSDLPNDVVAATLFKFDEVLGLGLPLFQINIDPKAQELIKKRQAARDKKDYRTADEVREQLEKIGYGLRDTPNGSEWYKR